MTGPGDKDDKDEEKKDEEDEFSKLLRLANEASYNGNQDLANELIDKLLDLDKKS